MNCDEAYASLVRDVLSNGQRRQDRTGTGTLSVFGRHLRIGLRPFPLLTTKRVFWRGVVEELLFFLRGETDTTVLEDRGVKIWALNTRREHLDNLGLTSYPEGTAGPIYGYQWRAYNRPYTPGLSAMETTEHRVDQIASVMEGLRRDPYSRRHIITSWNPLQIPEMCLPPCHMTVQFYVRSPRVLDCQMYQRSSDVGLGLPFNIASYGLLTYLMATTLDMEPGELSICIGDCHIYLDHVEALQEQISRDPFPLPDLRITAKKQNLEEYTSSDIQLDGYTCHPTISMVMSA